jgi:hypothetical protein
MLNSGESAVDALFDCFRSLSTRWKAVVVGIPVVVLLCFGEIFADVKPETHSVVPVRTLSPLVSTIAHKSTYGVEDNETIKNADETTTGGRAWLQGEMDLDEKGVAVFAKEISESTTPEEKNVLNDGMKYLQDRADRIHARLYPKH